MLKTILSVTGKPGLFKLISSGKNMIIVESLVDKKRLPIYARDKVVSLGDIAIYTDQDEVPLQEVLILMKKKENGVAVATISQPEELQKYLGEILPTFDRERVYNTDIKKLINWYNLLVASDIDFEKTDAEEETPTEGVAADAKKEDNPKKATAKKDTVTTKKPTAKVTTPKAAKSAKVMNRKAQ